MGLILLEWGLNEYRNKKEKEAQSEHTEELVRTAHKYREIERELKTIQRQILEKTGSGVSAEEGAALEEVEALRKESGGDERGFQL